MEEIFKLYGNNNDYMGEFETDSPGFAARTILSISNDLLDHDQEIKIELIDEKRFRVLTGGNEYLLVKN